MTKEQRYPMFLYYGVAWRGGDQEQEQKSRSDHHSHSHRHSHHHLHNNRIHNSHYVQPFTLIPDITPAGTFLHIFHHFHAPFSQLSGFRNGNGDVGKGESLIFKSSRPNPVARYSSVYAKRKSVFCFK